MSDNIEGIIKSHRAQSIAHMASQFEPMPQDENEEDVNKGEDDLELKKGEETNPFDSYKEDDNVEKSDIMSAMSYENPIRVSKSGKELKEQAQNVLLPELNAALETKKSEADGYLKECGQAPTKPCPEWWCGGIKMDIGYKMYEWDETYWRSNEDQRLYPTLSAEDSVEQKARINAPESKEQAFNRTKYNECVQAICNILVDIKACEIISNVADNKTFELTPKQIIALRF